MSTVNSASTRPSKIAPHGTPIHSREFEAAAITPLAREGTLKAAKMMELEVR